VTIFSTNSASAIRGACLGAGYTSASEAAINAKMDYWDFMKVVQVAEIEDCSNVVPAPFTDCVVDAALLVIADAMESLPDNVARAVQYWLAAERIKRRHGEVKDDLDAGPGQGVQRPPNNHHRMRCKSDWQRAKVRYRISGARVRLNRGPAMIITDLQAEHHIFAEDERTPPLFSVPGSIAASFGLGIDDLPHLFGGRGEGHGYMVTKWRMPVNLLNELQPAANIAATIAKNWRMDDVPDDEPYFPGCLISARAIIHASAASFDFAVELYERMRDLRPEGWEKDTGRAAIMARIQSALPSNVQANDHPTIEGALCRMIGFKPGDILKTGLVVKQRAAELVNGRSLWRQDEIDDVMLPAIYEASCRLQAAIPYDLDYDDEHLDAMAALWPALAASERVKN